MNEDELQKFKIGDRQRPSIRSGATASSGTEKTEAAVSVGFPNIEQRIEAESIDAAVAFLRPSYAALEKLSASGDKKLRTQATKAMAAYERTADLLEYLFETKKTLAPSK